MTYMELVFVPVSVSIVQSHCLVTRVQSSCTRGGGGGGGGGTNIYKCNSIINLQSK